MVLGTYERSCVPWQPKQTPWEFGRELLQPDLASGSLVIAHPARRPTTRHFTLQYEARLAADPSLTAFADWLCARFARADDA